MRHALRALCLVALVVGPLFAIELWVRRQLELLDPYLRRRNVAELRLLERVGLVWDVNTVTPEAEMRKRIRAA